MNTPSIKTIEETVKVADGFDIPTRVLVPGGSGPHPVVFYVHGGGWMGKDPRKVPPAATGFYAEQITRELGFVCVGVAYRCIPHRGTYSKALADILDTIEYVRTHADKFRADPRHMAIAGSSAGALLAYMAARATSGFRSFIGISGMYDLVRKGPGSFPTPRTLDAFGIGNAESGKVAASPIHNLGERPLSTLLLHGEMDTTIHWMQSLRFLHAIRARGGQAEMRLLGRAAHGIDRKDSAQVDIAVADIRRHLQGDFRDCLP